MAAAAPGDRALVLLSALWLFVMLLMLLGMLWLGLQDRKGGAEGRQETRRPPHQ